MNALESILNRLHPAFIALDNSYCILRTGEIYQYLAGNTLNGKPFDAHFLIVEPENHSLQQLILMQSDNVQLSYRPTNLSLRGMFIPFEGVHYFIGSPWFSLESAQNTQLSPFLAKSHEAWGDLLMATRLLEQQKRDLYRILTDLKARSEERDVFHAFYSLSPDLMCTFSPELKFLNTNPRWYSLLGWNYEELNQHHISEFIFDDDLNSCLGNMSKLLSGVRNHIEYECRFLHKSGKFIELSWVMHIRNNILYATARDVTIRNQLSFALADREHRLRSLFDSANDAIFTFSEKGDVLSLNKSAVRLFQYTETQMKNFSFFQLFRTSSKTQFYFEGFGNIIESSIGSHVEFEGVASTGKLFPVEISFSRLTSDKEVQFLAIIRDITERKVLERMQSEFISTVTHELRTPLTSIMGSLSLLKMLSADVLTGDSQKVLDIAQNNSNRLIKLINDLLDIGKIQSGNFTINLKSLEINSVVKKALDANAGFALTHHTELKLTTSCPPTFVFGDEDRLLQIMANLISNAIKFSQDTKRVEVSTQLLPNNKVRVSVIDFGPGINPEFYGRIFQRFSQADGSDRRIQGGTGLGLSISKSLIELMGGKIDFSSIPNKGTTFFFDIPTHQPADQ